MVIGLNRFRQHFAPYANQYVLIGGTACTIIMQESGLDFRATKDLDIVLYVEALNLDFASAFWKFIEEGRYQNRQRSTGKEVFYRFATPATSDYPSMIEIFSRIPGNVKFSGTGHLTPIPINETVASLSAILLDDDYYNFIHLGKQQINDLSVLDAVHLIPLKARAYIDLIGRKQNGENIDEKDIRKHKNDVIRLYQLLSANSRKELPLPIKNDMSLFLNDIKNDKSIDCKNLGLKNVDAHKIIEILGGIYGISLDVLVTDNAIKPDNILPKDTLVSGSRPSSS